MSLNILVKLKDSLLTSTNKILSFSGGFDSLPLIVRATTKKSDVWQSSNIFLNFVLKSKPLEKRVVNS